MGRRETVNPAGVNRMARKRSAKAKSVARTPRRKRKAIRTRPAQGESSEGPPEILSVPPLASEAEEETADRPGGPSYLRAFAIMPFGADQRGAKIKRETQERLFQLLMFALNDAYYQNYANRAIRNWKPIKLERADIGAGWSADLLDNVLRKIDKSDFCVVDFTHDNLNVALEWGYALANDKFLLPFHRRGDVWPASKAGTSGEAPHIADLAGKLIHEITLRELMDHKCWRELAHAISRDEVIMNQGRFFGKTKIDPFLEDDAPLPQTYLLASVPPEIKERQSDDEWRELENLYRRDLVRRLYSAFRPLSEKLDAGATEVEYSCTAYASRQAANLSAVFRNAKSKIRILTTNLEGLVDYIDDIVHALKGSKGALEVDVLTLNPDSEFVNARGQLIGKEIARFRREMNGSLDRFKQLLRRKDAKKVAIKTYSEFPTQISFFVDDDVYSAAVSVNHQSRHNIVFKVPVSRKGVAESFSQHWDTIWARATEVG